MAVHHCIVLSTWVLLILVVIQSTVAEPHNVTTSRDCYYLPSDLEWPSTSEWAELNKAVNGRLIVGRPMAEVCRGSGVRSEACVNLQKTWTFGDPQYVQLEPQ
jgi:hypothetical protein